MFEDVTGGILRDVRRTVVTFFVGDRRAAVDIQYLWWAWYVSQLSRKFRVLPTDPEIGRPIFFL